MQSCQPDKSITNRVYTCGIWAICRSVGSQELGLCALLILSINAFLGCFLFCTDLESYILVLSAVHVAVFFFAMVYLFVVVGWAGIAGSH